MLSGFLGILPLATWRIQKLRSAMHSFFCRLGLIVMGVKTQIEGLDKIKGKNFLIVSNHLSYLDILIIAANFPSSFVTSVEIKETPGLGLITRWAGCLFVERRSKENIHNEISEITEALKNGLNVTIFPEATSTNGESVLRFRSPLYNAAIFSEKDILPICLNYQFIGNEPINLSNRDKLCWYGDMSFMPHLIELMKNKRIKIKLDVLEPLTFNGEQRDAKLMAQITHQRVSEKYVPIQLCSN
jgi:1-acyl-sn-glycerol-3-phosphate acyltransferase